MIGYHLPPKKAKVYAHQQPPGRDLQDFVGVAGQPLPAFLKLEDDGERSAAAVSPILLLKKWSLELRVFTFIQYMRDKMFDNGDGQRSWNTEHQITFVDFTKKMETALARTKHFDLRDVVRFKGTCLPKAELQHLQYPQNLQVSPQPLCRVCTEDFQCRAFYRGFCAVGQRVYAQCRRQCWNVFIECCG